MFKKFIAAVAATSLVASPAFAGKFGGGGFRSSGSSFSSSRSFSSGSTYRPSSNYTRPAAPAAAPRFNNTSGYNYKPAQTRVVPRQPTYAQPYSPAYHPVPQVNNHYYGGGGFGSSFGGAFTGSLLGNMLFSNHNQAPVYVNNGGGYAGQAQAAPMQGDPGQVQYAQQPPQDTGPGFFGMIFWGFINLLTLIAIGAVLVWIVRKVIKLIRGE